MALKWDSKDPDAVLNYRIDWLGTATEPGFLYGTSDTIVTSIWIMPTGTLAKNSDTHDAVSTTIWLSGGTAGVTYSLTNRITTAGGLTNDCTEKLKVKQR